MSMQKYEVLVEVSGYVRGNVCYIVEAENEEEALSKAEGLYDHDDVALTRDDREAEFYVEASREV